MVDCRPEIGFMTDLMELGSLDELADLFEQRTRAARDRIGPATPKPLAFS
jgi:hypothetical protein